MTQFYAHRGGGKYGPENTLAGFRAAAAIGFRAFECDVMVSADGVPFLMHDSRLERTTSVSGLARDRRWVDLSCIDAGCRFGRSFAGEPIAQLATVATFVKANGYALNIEIKTSGDQQFDDGEIVASEISRLWRGRNDTPLVSSFSVPALYGCQAISPEIDRSLILSSMSETKLNDLYAVQGSTLVIDHLLVDAHLVKRLHEDGKRCIAYTDNSAARADELSALGVDGIITDELVPVV